MFQNPTSVPFLNGKQEAQFIAAVSQNPMHKFAALLMLDGGLRVSEVTNLLIKDFNFPKQEVRVKSLKKRKDVYRIVPLSKRVLDAAAEWWQKVKDKSPEAKMFPVCRETIFKYFKGKSNGLVHPHLLRHTCATNLISNGADVFTVRDVLGHSESRTTEIYIHAADESKRLAIQRVEDEKTSWFERQKEKWFPSRKADILPMAFGQTKFHVGRRAELERLLELYQKKVNTLILAPQGFGKSHLLDNFQADNLLRIDDCREFRKTLANMIIKIVGEDKEAVADLLNIDPSVITRESLKRLVDILKQITQKEEYTILIDDATALTPTAIKALESLRSHFHFIVAARQVETKNASWLSNFEKIELQPLNRIDTIELILRASENFRERIQDVEQFKNHVWRQTNGVPQFILEMVERYQKEDVVSIESIDAIQHTAGRGEIDAMPFVLLLFGSLIVLKFYAKEAMEGDKEAFMILGAVGLLAVMFGRAALRGLKRKYI